MYKFLVAAGQWDAAREEALRARLDVKIKAAVERAEAHPPPARETVFDDVYQERPWHLEEQKEAFLSFAPAPIAH